MLEPIKAGDDCRIIRGMAQHKSPNVGKVVKVGATIMGFAGAPHTKYGRVVHVTGDGVKQLDPDSGEFITTGWADIPVAWLEKIDPASPPPAAVKTESEVPA